MSADSTVFVVDDDADARRAFQWLLESEGFNVETHSSALEFLDSYDPTKPACLLADVDLPKMNGLDLQDELALRGQSLPTIFVTAFGDIPSSVRAMKAGALDFLQKPVQRDALLPLVRRAFREDRRRRDRELAMSAIELRLEQLSSREREVTAMLYAGITMKGIAAKLGISIQTVSKHRLHALEKLDVESDVELIKLLVTYEHSPIARQYAAGVPKIQESHRERKSRRVDPASPSRRRSLGSAHSQQTANYG